jgi:Uma2 family endonuclease
MLASTANYKITWEKLPDDFVLDDEPVDNINQPSLAAALTESLEIAGKLPANALITTNYGICATVNQKMVVKAPDWAYIPSIRVPREEVKRSYTPRLQGDIPVIVMEFLSDTEGGEYSSKPTYPPGKWFFYQRVLEVPNYVIFEPDAGELEVYQLDDSAQYQLQNPDANNRYWIAQMRLFLGVWQGTRENRTGFWLRWWDEKGELLLWGSERAEQLSERAERLAAQLRAAGIEPEA